MSSSIFPAKDSVQVAEKTTSLLRPPTSSYRMCSLQYDAPNEPSLAEFRILLHLVSTMSPNYQLWQEQCYWFCNSIMVIMEKQFPPRELVQDAAYNRKGKIKNLVRLPSNASMMTNIQRAFESSLASNAHLLKAHGNPPNRPPFPYYPNSDPSPYGPLSQTSAQRPTQPYWANSEPVVSLHPQPSPKSEPYVHDPVLTSKSNLSSLPSLQNAFSEPSLQRPPTSPEKFTIVYKCEGEQIEDCYISVNESGTNLQVRYPLAVSLAHAYRLLLSQMALSYAEQAFQHDLPEHSRSLLTVEDNLSMRGFSPLTDQEFMELLSYCRLWRLHVV